MADPEQIVALAFAKAVKSREEDEVARYVKQETSQEEPPGSGKR